MLAAQGGFRAGVLFPAAFILMGFSAIAAEFRLDDLRKVNGPAEVRFTKEPGFYYILWRGDQPADIHLATDLSLGTTPPHSLADTNSTNSAQFYRVEKLPLTSLRDTDGDGLNDAWELLHRHPGAALNGADAEEDHDGNGVADRMDALRESLRAGGVRGRPMIAAGAYHSLAIKNDGTLWGWGDNITGELGSSGFTETNVPVQIGTDTNWSAVSCRDLTSYGLKGDGTLWSWADASTCCAYNGQLGLGDSVPSSPTQIGTETWAAVAASVYYSVGIKSDGSLWWWGANMGITSDVSNLRQTNAPARLGTNTGWIAITSGYEHVVALRADGTVSTFGYNELGKLGNGTTGVVKEPTQVGGEQDWIGVATGTSFSFGLKTNGTLWAWGLNTYGVLGLGDFASSSTLRQVPGSNWISVSGGGDHTTALQGDGSLWVWGKYVYTDGNTVFTNVPTRLGADSDWKMISAGRQHSLALKNDGSLWSWGVSSSNGELGTGGGSTPVPQRVGSAFWTNISAGHYASLGVQTSRSLWSWGRGVRYNPTFLSPSQVGSAFDWKIAANAKAHYLSSHALALKRNGTLWSWGYNFRGQLGNGTITSTEEPGQIGTSTNWMAISVGDTYSGALQNNGSLWMTGENFYGQLGFGMRVNTNQFTQVVSATNWTAFAAGEQHTLGLKADGTLWAWGDNRYGQCAQPALFEPVPVAGTNWGRPR